MEISALEESQLLSLLVDPNELFVEFTALTHGNVVVSLFSHNRDTSKIRVEFYGLSLNAGRSEANGRSTLGEIESISVKEGQYTLEGDFGAITVFSDTSFLKSVS